MPDETRHESADLEDYSVQDPADSLLAEPEGDPLDRGVAPPERWSAAMRFGSTADEQEAGESLDELLAEEEPDDALDLDMATPADDEHVVAVFLKFLGSVVGANHERAGRIDQLLAGVFEPLPFGLADAVRGDEDRVGHRKFAPLLFADHLEAAFVQVVQDGFVVDQLTVNGDFFRDRYLG